MRNWYEGIRGGLEEKEELIKMDGRRYRSEGGIYEGVGKGRWKRGINKGVGGGS